MNKSQIDDLDVRIISKLADNARRPFQDIARDCCVSGAAVHQRVQKMVACGAIKGFVTVADPALMGYDTCAYVGFILEDPTQFDSMVEHLCSVPEVTECHCTSGKYDLFVKIYANNNRHLLELITRMQTLIPCRTETLISFRESFSRPLAPQLPREPNTGT